MAEYNPSKIIKDGNTYNFRDTTKIPLTGSNEISGNLIPSTDGTVNLGSTAFKWKSFNGIAPDELGLPTSTYTDVSSYITNFDSTPNAFTAPVSGLFFLGAIHDGNNIECALFNDTKGYFVNASYGYNNIRGLLPVEKGDTILVYISSSSILTAVKIFHLKGKV